jgi:16S rRNA (cytidine1402-2'-O)-methyltransferase
MAGLLYLVATPIGNLEDITYRAVRLLREADLIACEDTRQTRKLLDHYEIHKPTISYHEHNEAERSTELASRLAAGAVIALVSDAGMPLVSDHRGCRRTPSGSAGSCRRSRDRGRKPWRHWRRNRPR